MDGIVTDIQRFSVHDGPGIRTTVFLKGCQLHCRWCHNPESIQPGPQLQDLPDKCIGCGVCRQACPHAAHGEPGGRRVFYRPLCQACGSCARTCYAEALVLVGRPMSAEQVLGEVLDDRPFYATSGGGVTLSGGEPLFQREFALQVLRLCRAEGIHTALETNLAWPWEHVEPIRELADLVLFDIKTMDRTAHEEWTGAHNGLILENARRLGQAGAQMIVRTPVVPGFNDSPTAIGLIADFVATLDPVLYYELLPYHPLGTQKYESLGQPCRLAGVEPPSRRRIAELASVARRRGIKVLPED